MDDQSIGLLFIGAGLTLLGLCLLLYVFVLGRKP